MEEVSDVVRTQLALAYSAKDLLGYGLRKRLREGYTAKDFRADLLASLVVADAHADRLRFELLAEDDHARRHAKRDEHDRENHHASRSIKNGTVRGARVAARLAMATRVATAWGCGRGLRVAIHRVTRAVLVASRRVTTGR